MDCQKEVTGKPTEHPVSMWARQQDCCTREVPNTGVMPRQERRKAICLNIRVIHTGVTKHTPSDKQPQSEEIRPTSAVTIMKREARL